MSSYEEVIERCKINEKVYKNLKENKMPEEAINDFMQMIDEED